MGNSRTDLPKGLPFRLTDYPELVYWTGRLLREGKRGSISADLPPFLERLQIDPKYRIYLAGQFESQLMGLVGAVQHLGAA